MYMHVCTVQNAPYLFSVNAHGGQSQTIQDKFIWLAITCGGNCFHCRMWHSNNISGVYYTATTTSVELQRTLQ